MIIHAVSCDATRIFRSFRRPPKGVKSESRLRPLGVLDQTDLLICDELGYLSFSRRGAELLFQVFADRYERASLLITGNRPA